jgi:hypothetical protein
MGAAIQSAAPLDSLWLDDPDGGLGRGISEQEGEGAETVVFPWGFRGKRPILGAGCRI